MLTPQAIKDQEFQIKFRGYDAIEVKAYLELLAEDYFELTEQTRVHEEEIDSLRLEIETLKNQNADLEAEIEEGKERTEGKLSEVDEEQEQMEKEVLELRKKLQEIEEANVSIKEENETCQELIEELEEKVAGVEEEKAQEQAAAEKLKAKVDTLQERNSELKQEGADFKTTILAAQNFANNLRETTEENAKKIIEEAKAEVAQFRADAQEELTRLPREIEELEDRKSMIRGELKDLLHSYLGGLDVFPEKSKTEAEEE
jgi:DivIVA domain-containing protein